MMSPWEITKFENFLKDKESYIKEKVKSDFGIELTTLIFKILQAELKYEMNLAEDEMLKYDERRDMAKEERVDTRIN